MRFVAAAGYRRLTLRTNDVLHAARAIYKAEGFELVERSAHVSFGQALIGETRSLDLERASADPEQREVKGPKPIAPLPRTDTDSP